MNPFLLLGLAAVAYGLLTGEKEEDKPKSPGEAAPVPKGEAPPEPVPSEKQKPKPKKADTPKADPAEKEGEKE